MTCDLEVGGVNDTTDVVIYITNDSQHQWRIVLNKTIISDVDFLNLIVG